MGGEEQNTAMHLVNALITDLRSLRQSAGSPSFGELALRVMHCRMDAGMSEAAARVSKSTVYDVFQLGRRRINPDLLAEILLALGASEAEAEEWRRRTVCAGEERSAGTRRSHAPSRGAEAIRAEIAHVDAEGVVDWHG